MDIVEEAKRNCLSERIIKELKDSGITVEDLPVDGATIKEEFPSLTFRERQELKQFLSDVLKKKDASTSDIFGQSCLMLLNSSAESSYSTFLTSSPAPEGESTPSYVESEVSDVANDIFPPRSSATLLETRLKTNEKTISSKTFTSVKAQPQQNIWNMQPYPGSLGTHFPFTDIEKHFLKTVKKEDLKHSQFVYIVKKIEENTTIRLQNKPTKSEQVIIARNLITEYPVLTCNGDQPWAALMAAVRKRIHNQFSKATLVLGIHNTKPKSPKKRKLSKNVSQVDATQQKKWEDERNDRMLEIKHLCCNNSVEEVLKKYPEYGQHPEKCIEEYAAATKRTTDTLWADSKKNWEAFSSKCTVGGGDPHSFEYMKNVVAKLDVEESYIFLFTPFGLLESLKKSHDQPFLLCLGNKDDLEMQCSICIDRKPFVEIGKANAFQGMVYLLATYYLLNLAYPVQAKLAYQALEHHVFGVGKTPCNRKYKSLFQ
ncbi:uncharacterized protein LOC143460512 isoform X1 [Clavelina lepadiformis]|uniref:uncharacterized protein LOC143460512 isoform X1 n=2 Tax=Clavelina lepadiformis TaxID=159417 RepID=UPI00404169B7